MIRPATADDLPTLLALGRAMHDESPTFSVMGFDDDKLRETLTSLIENPGRGCVIVAEYNGAVVGGVAGLCVENWFSRDKVASDIALFLAPEHRHGTRATRLILAYVAWAKGAGAAFISMGITTGVHPEATARLYRAIGFEPSGASFRLGCP